MELYSNELWISDVDAIIDSLPELAELNKKSVMITGAAGLICSSVVDILMRYNDRFDAGITVLAAGRWPEEMELRFGSQTTRKD